MALSQGGFCLGCLEKWLAQLGGPLGPCMVGQTVHCKRKSRPTGENRG